LTAFAGLLIVPNILLPPGTLNLEFNSLEGEIPKKIYELSNLQELRLGGNSKLYGQIDPDIRNLTSLTELSLGNSQFNGTLPSSLFELVELIELDLSGASFFGPLPDSFSNLKDLRVLFLNNNTFTGTIPDVFDNMTSISKFSLAPP
jgi:Leucine-rich repeat (LRR) protein